MSWHVTQHLNFYTDEFRPPRLPADIASVLKITGLTVGGLLAMTLLLLAARVWQHTEVSEAESRRQTLENAIAAEMQRLPPLVVDPELEQQLQWSKARLQNSQKVLTYLSREGQAQRTSFTPLIEQLGQVQSDGIWLSGFSLMDAGQNIELKGYVREARQLSPYIAALASQPAYQGRAFRQVVISEENRGLVFRLDTRPAPLANSLLVNGGKP